MLGLFAAIIKNVGILCFHGEECWDFIILCCYGEECWDFILPWLRLLGFYVAMFKNVAILGILINSLLPRGSWSLPDD